MKRFYILLLLVAFSNSFLHAQDCNIGSTSQAVLQDMSSDYLFAQKHTLNSNGVLHSINLIGNYTGSNVKMAVYTDNGGVPGDLVIASDPKLIVGGTVSLPVTATQLYPGDYWITAVYDANGESTFGDGSATTHYVYMNYASNFPTTITGTTSYDGYMFSYFLEISCGTLLSVEDENMFNQVRLYPNPNNGLVHLDFGNSNNVTVRVFNALGQVVYSFENIKNATHQFEFSAIAGVYYVEIASDQGKETLKLIKE